MSDEQPSPDSGAQALRASVGEIRQSLDALADRLHRLEAAPDAPPSLTRGGPVDIFPADIPDARDALAGAGYRVESATDGLTGLARFQGEDFDVVLTDLSLPECSGLDVARSVKRLRPETPVVLITGWGHLLDPERLRDSGVDLMLVKPFRLERLLAVLGDALRLRPSV